MKTQKNTDIATVGAMLGFAEQLEYLRQLSDDDFLVPGTVIQLGVPPRRIDLLTSITAVEFPAAWDARIEVSEQSDRICVWSENFLTGDTDRQTRKQCFD